MITKDIIEDIKEKEEKKKEEKEAREEEKKASITKDMLIGDLLMQYPSSIRVLLACGMGCISCPASQLETIEEACAVHGLDADDVVEELVKRV